LAVIGPAQAARPRATLMRRTAKAARRRGCQRGEREAASKVANTAATSVSGR